MNDTMKELARIRADAESLEKAVDALIERVRGLRPEITGADEEKQRHRLEMELLNMKDMMWIRRG
jgi:hypothetical protein